MGGPSRAEAQTRVDEQSEDQHLSEDIGYRAIGTTEHALVDKWMVDTAYEIQECERLVRADPGGPTLECEGWHQRGSGSHQCIPHTSTHFLS